MLKNANCIDRAPVMTALMQTTHIAWITLSLRPFNWIIGASAGTRHWQIFRRLPNSRLAQNSELDAALLTSPIFTSKETL